MAFSISATSSTVAVVGNLTASIGIPSGATWVQYHGGPIADGTNVRTVTSGKTFYIMGIKFSNGNAVAKTGRFKIDGTVKFLEIMPAGTGQQPPATIGTPLIVATSGQALTAHTDSGATDLYFTMWGYEE